MRHPNPTSSPASCWKTRRQILRRALVLSVIAAASGCHARNEQRAVHYPYHNVQPVVSHQALPTGGFDTDIQAPHVSVPRTAIDPTANLPAPRPSTYQGPLIVPRDDVLSAWDVFQNPRLRSLQKDALQSAMNSGEMLARINEAAEYGGRDADDDVTGTLAIQNLFLQRTAETFVDVRVHQQQLVDCYQNLSALEKAREHAISRKESGKAGKLDIIAFDSQIGSIKSTMSPLRSELRDDLRRMAVLTGAEMSKPVIRGIADQPQLSLPALDQRLPASVLRQRCDVRSAETAIASIAGSQGVSEADIAPLLSLQGELTAKLGDAGGDSEAFGFSLGNQDGWSLVTPKGEDPMRSDQFASPMQRTLNNYRDVVMSAAQDVESLLTKYHLNLHEVQTLEAAVENAREATRLSMQQYGVDRVGGDQVAAHAGRMFEAGQMLPDARARLAETAIELFKAMGGECNFDQVPTASFYHNLDRFRR